MTIIFLGVALKEGGRNKKEEGVHRDNRKGRE
jgi:hypothetical protein